MESKNVNSSSLVFVNNCSNCSLWDDCPHLEEREQLREEKYGNLHGNNFWCRDHPDIK
nr:MAG: hypothetical protein [uncultured archaeon]